MQLKRLILLLFMATAPMPAQAHAGAQAGTLAWNFEPLVLVTVLGAATWYLIGLVRLREETGRAVLTSGNIAAFMAGLVVLLVALCSPVDTVGEELFSVHMVQHLLLMLLAAPLLVLGRPALAFLWAMPPRRRKTFGRVWTGGKVSRLFEFLMQPLTVWLLFTGVFVFWHVPGPYTWALRNELVHDLEHISFLLISLMFWTIVFEPYGRRRLDYGSTLLFVATTAIFSGLPGALMILTSRPFYTAHAATVGNWGLTLVEDQHLAGLIMWVPAGMVYVAAVAWLFWRWIDADAARTPVTGIRSLNALPNATMLMLICVLIGGCDDAASSVVRQGQVAQEKRGAQVIAQFGCGTCHTIPGIAGADANVGPPLTGFGKRLYIAGMLRNTPDNLQRWLKNPQAVVPGNVMPDMGLSDGQARDAAAYLRTLN
jgi:cytochrome c oxidase assembly factor CtaG/cytochrome c2